MFQQDRLIHRIVLAVIACAMQSAGFAQNGDADLAASLESAYRDYIAASETGDLLAASVAAEQALTISRELYGENNPNTATLYLNYAATLNLRQQADAAEQAYLAVLGIYDNLYGESSAEHVPVLLKLGAIGSTNRHKAYLGDALALQRQHAPNDLPAYADLALEVSLILLEKFHDRTTAYSVLKPVFDQMEQAYGEDAPVLARALMALGTMEGTRADSMPQKRRYWRAIEIAEDAFPDDPTVAAGFALEAGRALLENRHFSDARSFLEDAHDIFLDELGPENARTAMAAASLGEVLKSQNRCKRAEEPLLNALSVFADDARYRPEESQTRIVLANCYEQLEESEKATEQFMALARIVEFVGVSEFLPVTKPLPEYPPGDAAAGNEGYVILEYTVDATGRTRDIAIIESTISESMERAAIRSAGQYRYIPRVVDGQVVAVSGVRTRIDFVLEPLEPAE